ncbi:MAG: tetratricopeptide repeat protein [Planctomycetales bacterium]|nr:tetratricopeptide repeat protein [Planctomycetales bacterium]
MTPEESDAWLGRVDEILALARAGEDVEAALAALPPVRQEEVRQLLAAEKGVLGPPDTVADAGTGGPGTALGDGGSGPPELLPGTMLGPYQVEERIGRGGMSVVYRAHHAGLGRDFALKVLRPGLSLEPEALARFRREARAAASLADHPGIVAAHDMGEADGRLYFVMDLVDGTSLRDLAGQTDLAPQRAATIIAEAARAAHYAHGRGILHRDVKPGNILVSSAGRVRLTDFGLAKAIRVQSSTSLTRTGAVMGSPSYMSPEQARGQALDPRADVYGLGASLYEALTGRPPFTGDSTLDLLASVCRADPVLPRRLNPRVPRDLETIALKCLEKDPDRRYPTAEALAADLERWLKGEPIAARPPGWLRGLVRAARRRRGLATAAAAALVAAGLVAAIALPSLVSERQERARVEREGEAELAALAELSGLWARLVIARQGLANAASDPASVRAEISAAAEAVSAYAERHPRQPQAPYVRARARLYLGRLGEAEADAREAIRLEEGFVPGHALLARILLERYREAQYQVGSPRVIAARQRAAAPLLEEARRHLARARAAGPGPASLEAWRLLRTREDDVGDALVAALSVYYLDGDRAGGVARLAEAHARSPAGESAAWLGALDKAPGAESRWWDEAARLLPHSPRVYLDRGTSRTKAGDLAGAEQDFTRALELDPRDARALTNRAAVKHRRGDSAGAIADCTAALALDPRNSAALNNRGQARWKSGDLAGALADLSAVLDLVPEDPEAWLNRGSVRDAQGDLDGALSDLDRALALDPAYAMAHYNRGVALHKRGESREAIEAFSRAIERDPAMADAWCNRGSAHHALGDVQAALDDFTRAIALDEASPQAWHNRGLVRAWNRDLAGAEADFAQALALAPPGWPPRADTEKNLEQIRKALRRG